MTWVCLSKTKFTRGISVVHKAWANTRKTKPRYQPSPRAEAWGRLSLWLLWELLMLFSTLGLTHSCFPFLCCIHSLFHRLAGDMKWAQGYAVLLDLYFQLLTPEKTGLHLPSLCYLTPKEEVWMDQDKKVVNSESATEADYTTEPKNLGRRVIQKNSFFISTVVPLGSVSLFLETSRLHLSRCVNRLLEKNNETWIFYR